MNSEITRQSLYKIPYEPTYDDDGNEETQMITVRVPRLTHEWLKRQAKDSGTSLNMLCTSRLIAEIKECGVLPPGVRGRLARRNVKGACDGR